MRSPRESTARSTAPVRGRLQGCLAAGLLVGLAAAATFGAEQASAPGGKPADLAPLPAAVPAPKDNPTTPAKVALGKQLFFDPRLSGDNTMSCATCHLPKTAFADGRPRVRGRGGKELARNTPTVLNAAFLKRFLWDGRAATLEEQPVLAITSPDEMNQDLGDLEKELNAAPDYVRQFQAVFGTDVTRAGIGQALAAFQRTLVSRNAPLDRYLAGDRTALSEEARRGLELFRGDAGCVRCHNGPVLSDGQFYRLGIGTPDEGLGGVTGKKEDRFKFRTPSLRDVARTGPYMHDGSLKTLEEVVQFYYRLAPRRGPEGLPLDVEPLLGNSLSEVSDLVAFLEALSGEAPDVTAPPLPK